MIKVNIEFKDKLKFNNLIRYIENNLLYGELQAYMLDLADNTVKNMRNTISISKKRPSFGNNLENSIEATIINTTGGIDIGIGNVFKLKSQAPYFEVLDAGGYVPYSTAKGAPLGTFEGSRPTPGGAGQNWERSGDKGYFMKPKKAMEGIDYIGKAIRNLDIELKAKIIQIGGTFLNGMSKSSK